MSTSKWLNEVAQALARRGLPHDYVRRFTDELADHCEDLYQEDVSMDANPLSTCLGSPDELAHRAASELQQRTYAGRHPLVTFVVAPLPTATLLLLGLCITFALAASVVPDSPTDDKHLSVWATAVLQAFVWAMRYVPFIVGAILFCHLANRAVCGTRWSFVACALVAMLAGLFAVQLTLPTDGPGSGALMMGFAIPPGPGQLLQALAPFAVWLLYAGRELRRRTQLA